MLIYVQWAKATAEDWFAWDVTRVQQIRNAAKKAVPTASSALDNNPGWINAANCQGIEFAGYDHVAVEILSGGGLRITGWQDDTEDFGDTRWATRWDLYPPAPDPALGGVTNTVQQRTVWVTPDAVSWFGGYGPNVLPWDQFVLPPADQTFHGIWLTQEQFDQHRAVRSPHGWREWI